jgi:hypothetical protein
MTKCRSCSNRSPERNTRTPQPAEKLEKGPESSNPRYPQLFVGNQAIYSDNQFQMIVKVISDNSDEGSDRFTLLPVRVLRVLDGNTPCSEEFEVSQPVGQKSWKLQALL